MFHLLALLSVDWMSHKMSVQETSRPSILTLVSYTQIGPQPMLKWYTVYLFSLITHISQPQRRKYRYTQHTSCLHLLTCHFLNIYSPIPGCVQGEVGNLNCQICCKGCLIYKHLRSLYLRDPCTLCNAAKLEFYGRFKCTTCYPLTSAVERL